MNYTNIITRIKSFFPKPISNYKPLGRWNIDYCIDKINNKIDLSNEDHCGTCAQYAKSKSKSIMIIPDNKKNIIRIKIKSNPNPNPINDK